MEDVWVLVCADCGNADNLDVNPRDTDEKNPEGNPTVLTVDCPVCENMAEVRGLTVGRLPMGAEKVKSVVSDAMKFKRRTATKNRVK